MFSFLQASLVHRLARAITLFALFFWTAIVLVHFGEIIIRFYSPLPYWDYWDTVSRIERYRRFDIGVLWQQHNEHRIVLPEILFGADYIFFRGREILPLAISVLCYAATWAILAAALYGTKLPRLVPLSAISLAAIVMGWEGGALSVGAPFLVQWPLILIFAALALLLLARIPWSRRPWVYLAATIAVTAACNYTSANGLFLWPVLLLAAWVLRLPKTQFSILGVSAAVLVGIYFIGFHFSSDGGRGAGWRHPFLAISFMAAYFGMPFTLIRPWIGISAGFFELASYLVFLALAARGRVLNTKTGIVLLGFYLLCILTAAATALGRMDPQDPNFGGAIANRYIAVPLSAHAALILAGAWLLGKSRYYLWAPFLAIFVIGFALTGRSPRISRWSDAARNSFANGQLADLAFVSGVDDPALMRGVYPGAETVQQALPILRSNRLSTFADEKVDWLGKPATAVFARISERAEAGAITEVHPLESGLLVLGWTDSPLEILHSQEFVFVDEQQRIVGFGRKLPAGLPYGIGSRATPRTIAWAGFVNSHFQSKTFLPYIIDNRSQSIAPIGMPLRTPLIHVFQPNSTGRPIPSMNWTIEGHWSKNGLIPGAASQQPPPFVSYHESWNSNDANTGILTSSAFAPPPGNCFVISDLHGPTPDGLSAKVIDADTKQTIASIPIMGSESIWRTWVIDVPSSARYLQIVAEDSGRDWGEWLAISEPHACK